MVELEIGTVSRPLVPVSLHRARSRLPEGEGVAPVLGLFFTTTAILLVHCDALRLIVDAENPGEGFGSGRDSASLRKPHE